MPYYLLGQINHECCQKEGGRHTPFIFAKWPITELASRYKKPLSAPRRLLLSFRPSPSSVFLPAWPPLPAVHEKRGGGDRGVASSIAAVAAVTALNAERRRRATIGAYRSTRIGFDKYFDI